MQCPNCKHRLPEKKNPLAVCPACQALLYISNSNPEQVSVKKMNELHESVNAISKLMCNTVAGHKWSEGGYINTDHPYECVRATVCKRCFSIYISKTGEHQFVTEDIRDSSCEKRRACSACGRTETFTEHAYIRHIKDDTCEQELRCSRCGDIVQLFRAEHQFGEWIPSKSQCCKRTRKCQRCGISEEIIEHVGAWVVVDSRNDRSDGTEKTLTEERICKCCGNKEYQTRGWDSPWA